MTFFTKESATFVRGLTRNNSKEWMEEHRKDYQRHLRAPYLELATALCEQLAEVEPEYDTPPKQAVYRINRDVRFAKDKTPYKTEFGVTIGRNQRHDPGWPAYTCRVSLKGVWVAGGIYQPGTELRDHLRRYVGQNHKRLHKLEAATPFSKMFGSLQGDAHKRTPAELAEYAEAEPRVRNTQWVFWSEFLDKKLFTDPKLDQFILDKWEIARPVQEFLKDACRAR